MLFRVEQCPNVESQFFSAHVREPRRKVRHARRRVRASVAGHILRALARQVHVRDSDLVQALPPQGRPQDSVQSAAHRGPDSAMFHAA
jgi:hypothetical protein